MQKFQPNPSADSSRPALRNELADNTDFNCPAVLDRFRLDRVDTKWVKDCAAVFKTSRILRNSQKELKLIAETAKGGTKVEDSMYNHLVSYFA